MTGAAPAPVLGPIGVIKRRVARHFGLAVIDLESGRRSRDVARARQVAMYLARRLTRHSYPSIGVQFGGRDHTTAMHAVSTVERHMADESAFACLVGGLEAALRGEIGSETDAERLVEVTICRVRERLMLEAHRDPVGLLRRLEEAAGGTHRKERNAA